MNSDSNLLTGEFFVIQPKFIEGNLLITDEQINDKYKKGDIRIITEQARYPLDSIQSMIDSGKYNRNPEYQRRKRWDNKRKSRLIESFIMNVPIPPVFLYEVEYNSYEVMDGLQRLSAIYDFYKGAFKLESLEYWQELNGRTYNDLPEQIQKGIDRRYLSSIVLLQETAKSKDEAENLKQIVFERLNSGGEKLTPQETRNALLNGNFNKRCIELAKNDTFRRLWGFPLEINIEDELSKSDSESNPTIEKYRKMEDVELVLRFFAYRHIEKLKGITVEKFLDEYLKQANKYDDETINSLGNIFINTVNLIAEVLGDKAFLLPSRNGIDYKTPTKTIYDAIMQSFSKYIEHKDELIKNIQPIRDALYSNEDALVRKDKDKNNYIFDGRYNSRKDVQDRIIYYDTFLNNFIQ